MRPVKLQALASEMGGRVTRGDVSVSGVVLDSRRVRPGDLFVALPGHHADGHDFLEAAAAAGASAALVTRFTEVDLPQWCVSDPRRVLVELACQVRSMTHAAVVGVTGSNGKTTVKEMLAGILAHRGACQATVGNLNNELGVPLTLCSLAPEDRFAVVEMGCGRPGDINLLSSWARPVIGLVTNVGPAHLGEFGSLEAIARCKGELFAALPADGWAVINADDPFADTWEQQAAHCHILRFSLTGQSADITGTVRAPGVLAIELPDMASLEVHVPLPGRHNLANALAAAAAAYAAGATPDAIVAGLEGLTPTAGRLHTRAGRAGSVLIDDSYNANPASLRAALETAAAESGPLWLVLGDMGELGEAAPDYHAEAGALARDLGVARLYATGALSALAAEAFGEGGQTFASRTELIEAIRPDLTAGLRVLIKGSRSAQMDEVVQGLAADPERGGAPCY